jgi:hypothetical protein
MRAHVVLSSAATLALICASGALSPVQAVTLDVAALTQYMIENQGNAMTLLGLGFGLDPSSPVSFTNSVDGSAMSFSFMQTSGSMYEGKVLTLSGTGSFDPTTNILSTTASIGLGSTIFVDTGTLDLSAGFDEFEHTELKPKMPTPFFAEDMTDDECKTIPGIFEDMCYYTNEGVRIPGSQFNSVDFASLPNWNYRNSGVFTISGMGSLPSAGGSGTSTMAVIPEPSTWAMMLLGFAGVGLFRYRASRQRDQRLADPVEA